MVSGNIVAVFSWDVIREFFSGMLQPDGMIQSYDVQNLYP